MSWIKTDSSQVHSIAYDPIEQELSVRFACNKCAGQGQKEDRHCTNCTGKGHSSEYVYEKVGPEKYVAVRDADSVGRALGEHIKKAGHAYRRIA